MISTCCGCKPATPGLCALNYAQTLAGCAAAVNGAGLVQVIDSLHDRRHPLGISAHFLARGVLAYDDIADAVDFLRRTLPRDGGFNHLPGPGHADRQCRGRPGGFCRRRGHGPHLRPHQPLRQRPQ